MQNNRERKGKWMPYDALEGYKASLRKIDREHERVLQPVLEEDALLELNDRLAEALESKKPVRVRYFRNGSIKETDGTIEEVDPVCQQLLMDSTRINLDSILEINELYDEKGSPE